MSKFFDILQETHAGIRTRIIMMNPNACDFQEPVDDDAAVAFLKQRFPAWNRKHLFERWVSSSRNVSVCLREISVIESEISGAPVALARPRPLQPTPVWTPAPAASTADFPALGTEVPTTTGGACSTWASKAKTGGVPSLTAQQPRARPPPGFVSRSLSEPTRDIWSSGVQQVTTGAALSSQYAEARRDARDLAIARNKCFEEATRAFQRGDKALAKELGAKGRECVVLMLVLGRARLFCCSHAPPSVTHTPSLFLRYNQAMAAAHEVAAQSIFDSRNDVSISHGGRRVIDLHGLHVKEATGKLLEILDTAKRRGVEQEIDVVVGEGKHSKTNSGVLRRSVVDAVERAGFRFRENYAGLLTVYL